jgi:MFS transporter, ACDE family, multidrug resistance protein
MTDTRIENQAESRAFAENYTAKSSEVPINLRRIFLILFYGYFVFGVLLQVFPPLLDGLQSEFSVDNKTVSLVMSAFLAPIIALAIPAGMAVDRWGPTLAIRVGLGIMLAGVALILLTSSWSFLLAGRFVSGIGGALLLVALLKVAAQMVPREKLGLAVGIFAAGLPTGTGVAFNMLRPLEQLGGWRLVLFGAALLVLSAVFVIELAAGRALPRGGASVNVAQVLKSGPLWRLAAVTVFGYAAIIGFTTWAPKILANDMGISAAIAAFIASLLLVIDIPFAPFWGGVSDRLKKRKIFVLVAFGVYLTGSLLVPGAAAGGGVVLLVFIIAGMGIGCSMFFPAALAIPAETVPHEQSGAAYGLLFTAQVAGMLLGPQVIGLALDAMSATGAFLVVSLFTIVGFLLSFSLRAR